MRIAALLLLLPATLAAGTVTLANGTISVSGGNADSSSPPAYVTNPSAFGVVLTDGITTYTGQQRRNTDPTGGPNSAMSAVATFDGRQATISGTITALTIADSEAASGGHSQAFAIGLSTGGWRDQAAATYNLNLLASQPAPAKDGFTGIAFGYKSGSLYMVAYDYDSQPNQIFYNLGQAGLSSGQSLSGALSFTLVYSSTAMFVTVNNQPLGSVPISHDFSSALLVAMGASVDPANGPGTMSYSTLSAALPTTMGPPALLYRVSGDQQSGAAGAPLPVRLAAGVVDSYRNPLPGVTVVFAGTDATVSPSSAVTSSSGVAATSATLGKAPGAATVIASTGALPLVTFHLTALSSAAAPAITSVVNGAGFGPRISSGSWATILGSNLAAVTDIAQTTGSSLPTTLDGVSVTIDGRPAFIYYVSPTQINAIVPDDPTNGGVSVQVTNQGVVSNSATADKEDFAPAMFMFTSTYPAAVHADGSYLGPTNLLSGVTTHPAQPGEIILLFGTGFGPTNPLVPAGQLATNATPPAQLVTATVGGEPAEVHGYLIYPGMYQFNLTVPKDLPPSNTALSLSVVGSATQPGLMLSIAQ